MKKFLFLVVFGSYFLQAQVGIGTTTPSAAAMLEINSKSSDGSFKGFMPPRVTVSQRDLIGVQKADLGLLVFVNDPQANIYGLQIYNGVFWENVYLLLNSEKPTQIEYTVSSSQKGENSGALSFEFNIINPSVTIPLRVTVSASSYDDLDEKSAQVITIPANTLIYNAASIFHITDDVLVEGNEKVVFSITNVSGGTGASTVGLRSSFNLTIVDNDIKLWINEIHYDNTNADVEERVEIAGSAGVDLTGYSIVHYNGSNGAVLITKNILGSIPNQQAGLGTLNLDIPLLQNDDEGLALVDPAGVVMQFLSYEGVVTATAGPANGLTSLRLPVDETIPPPPGFSLQLIGTGSKYSDFTWAAGVASTKGLINLGQIFK